MLAENRFCETSIFVGVAIIAAMSGSSSLYGLERTGVRADSRDPDLRIFKTNVYVRDQQRSVDFYVNQLGFDLVADARFDDGERWVAVAPCNGSAVLALVAPKPDSEEYGLIGSATQIAFMTEDIEVTHRLWSEHGVHFELAPQVVQWGATFARFQDLDGNSFELIGSDAMTREIEKQRRTTAQRAEAERRSAQELSIAKEVQARLFPQTRPVMRTLEYAGMCIQARHVGGDYFDFLVLGRSAGNPNGGSVAASQCRLGLMVGDVSGKGIAAALLMANLQANVRSQTSMAVEHPECMLASVNELFFANSAEGSYATLFFAEYDDCSGMLRYANCGHLPGLVLRRDDSMVRLEATGRPLGLFGAWDCGMQSFQMEQGDTLLLYTDGVTECFDAQEEEFGEERLIEALRRHRGRSSLEMMESIVEELRGFGAEEQHDDITLIVARCMAEG